MAAGGMVDAGLALSYWYYEAFSFFALLDTHMAHNWHHVKARARGITLDKVARMRAHEKTASWVIREKSTGAVILETYNPAILAKLNTAKYEAVSIQQYLSSLNPQK